jgi:protein TonB
MKFGLILGIVGAVFIHVLILLFGGIFFMHDDDGASKTREVALLSETEAEKKKDEKELEQKPTEDVQESKEEVPDASELVRNLEVQPVNAAPALAEASLAAIEQALNGSAGGGGDFGGAMNFNSGGVIGGKGTGGVTEEKLEEAFSLSEIDQKPRAVYQVAGNYPGELRGKKLEGVVSVIFVVDASGRVSNPRIEKSSHPAFEKPALDAVKQWKFEAGVKGGERVACRMRVPMRFQPK